LITIIRPYAVYDRVGVRTTRYLVPPWPGWGGRRPATLCPCDGVCTIAFGVGAGGIGRMQVGPQSLYRILCLISLCVYLTPRLVMVGNACRPPESCFPIWVYHSLPRSVLAERIPVVVLVWCGWRLPIITMISHVNLPGDWCVWFGRTTHYQLLPCLRSGSRPAVQDLYQQLPPRPSTRRLM
jgi:hypothetical protein